MAGFTFDQLVALTVLLCVVGALIMGRSRADVVALCGAAVLLVTGAVRPSEVQGAFASPAIIALASLFVIAYAMELSGLLDFAIHHGVALCRRTGRAGIWIVIMTCGVASAFLNNTPIVVLGAPVIRDVAETLKLPPKQFLMPLSYAAVLGGCCTLIGSSTNLLVNDMAAVAGQPRFGIFEITPVGVLVALAGGLYLVFLSPLLLKATVGGADDSPVPLEHAEVNLTGAQVGSVSAFQQEQGLRPRRAITSGGMFIAVIVAASLNLAPIAACAFAGAVLLIVMRVVTPDEAYRGLRPEILMLIAGMLVLGVALEETGLAAVATKWLITAVDGVPPYTALVAVYITTLILTELLSHATMAVLVTPVAVAIAQALGVSPRPFLVAVMIAGSAAFATPFGYQTNVLVFQIGRYNYVDFLKVGLPLSFITAVTALAVIPRYFPF